MANYKVLLAVGARPVPTMNSTSKYQVAVGFTFTSFVVKADTTYGTPMLVQMPDGYYVPLIYNGKEYVKEIVLTGNKHFSLTVDGFQTFEGDLIPL